MPVLVEDHLVYEDRQGLPHLGGRLSVANDNGSTDWALEIPRPDGWKEAAADYLAGSAISALFMFFLLFLTVG
jgi:hypothetical protein